MTALLAQRLFRSAWMALLVATVIVATQIATKKPRPIYADELEYLTVSRNIVEHGVYSDDALSATRPKPSALFTPVAPYFYAALLKADPALHDTIACQMRHPADPGAHCKIAYGRLMPAVMTLFAAIGLWGGWVLARSLGLGYPAAWVVLAVVASSGAHAYFARHFLTETPLLAIFPFFLALLARATAPADRGAMPKRILLLLGLTMGLLALTRPSYVYQAYAILLLLPLLRHFRGATAIGFYGVGATIWAAAGYLLTVLPWMLRNAIQLDQFALTASYDINVLVQRMMYNEMSWAEWWMAWIYWLPDFGDNLAIALFGEDAVRKLSLLEPTGYHAAGNPQVHVFLRERLGDQPHTLGNLLLVLLAELPKHVMVTLVMAWQGLWAGKYITLVSLLLAPFALRAMAGRGTGTSQLRGFLVVALPVLMMIGFNAFVSVSIPRYNLPLLWLDGLVAAALVEAAIQHLHRTRISDSRGHAA